MSSGLLECTRAVVLGAAVLEGALVDGVGELSSEGSDRFGLGVAGGHATLQIGASWAGVAYLGDQDAVQGSVDLAIAAFG
jgi:hypothetical protein